MRSLTKQLAWISMVAALSFGANSALAIVVHDETGDGDLSNDRLNPTSISLTQGTNSLIATSVSGDREFVHFSIPSGQRLTEIILAAYSGGLPMQRSFIAVQEGTTFTEDPDAADVSNILGYSHFGELDFNVGDDILPSIGTGGGAIGFTPPLTGEDYTFWIQETGANAATYQLDFNLVPEPATLTILFGGVAWTMLLAGRKRRRK
jgi:hypothetical protein